MHELSHHNNYTQIHDCRSILPPDITVHNDSVPVFFNTMLAKPLGGKLECLGEKLLPPPSRLIPASWWSSHFHFSMEFDKRMQIMYTY